MEKKLAYRLYSIRLAETKYQALQNKENIIQTLSHLLLITSQICELTEKADQKELIIRLHEQSKIYLDESLTLHGEISSKTKSPQLHPVYTLHERHSRYLEFNEALKKVKDALTKQIEAFEMLSLSHLKSIRFIKGYILNRYRYLYINLNLSIGIILSQFYFKTCLSKVFKWNINNRKSSSFPKFRSKRNTTRVCCKRRK
jgi:hypothetical protein